MAPRAFGPFVLNDGKLMRDGSAVTVGQRGLAVLEALAEAEGAVVPKAVLLERAWPGVLVEEGNLAVQVAALRKALGPGPDGGEWIATVPRVGYRLVRALSPQVPAAQLPEKPALAVLPFANLGDAAEQDWFADGVVTEIITALARFRSLTVVSRNSSFGYKGRRTDVRQAAKELGVRYILEGSVRRAGERLRINTQLIDGQDGAHLWADQFEGGVHDVFDFQDRITQAVAVLVAPTIETVETRRSRVERPGSVAGYDLYLRALSLLNDESIESNAAAYALLAEALAIEPDNATTLAHAAWTLEHRSTMGWPPIGPDDRDRCVGLARQALRHAAGDPNLMAKCGMSLLQAGKDYDGGMAVLRAAAAANPNDLHVAAAAAVATMHCGDMEEALASMERAVRLAPRDPDTRFPLTGIAMIHIMRGQYEQALVSAAQSLALNAYFDATYWMLIAANAFLGRTEEAHRHLKKLTAIAPGVSLSRIRAGQPAKYPERIGAILEGLRMAGLPED